MAPTAAAAERAPLHGAVKTSTAEASGTNPAPRATSSVPPDWRANEGPMEDGVTAKYANDTAALTAPPGAATTTLAVPTDA